MNTAKQVIAGSFNLCVPPDKGKHRGQHPIRLCCLLKILAMPTWSDMMRRLLLAILLLSVAGCAALSGYRESVRVTVSAIEVLESTVLEQLYRVTLRVQNPNPQAITIRGGSFDLTVNGRDFGSGVSNRVLSVPAYSDAQLEVRMVSTLFGMVRLFQGISSAENPALSYEISGRFAADGFLGGVTFREVGEIAMPKRGPG